MNLRESRVSLFFLLIFAAFVVLAYVFSVILDLNENSVEGVDTDVNSEDCVSFSGKNRDMCNYSMPHEMSSNGVEAVVGKTHAAHGLYSVIEFCRGLGGHKNVSLKPIEACVNQYLINYVTGLRRESGSPEENDFACDFLSGCLADEVADDEMICTKVVSSVFDSSDFCGCPQLNKDSLVFKRYCDLSDFRGCVKKGIVNRDSCLMNLARVGRVAGYCVNITDDAMRKNCEDLFVRPVIADLAAAGGVISMPGDDQSVPVIDTNADVTVGGTFKKPDRYRNVLVIGWDAVNRARLVELLMEDRLPNLKRLYTEGRIVEINITSGATDTKAGWAQIITGYDPSVTGVYSNSIRFYNSRRIKKIPAGITFFERLEDLLGDENVETIFITGKTVNMNQLKKEIHDELDVFEIGLGNGSNVCERGLELLQENKDKLFVALIHFDEPDKQGHGFGENSAEYKEAIVRDDVWLGQMVEKLKGLGIYDKTIIYVVSDHGVNEGYRGHPYAPYTFLATNDPAVVGGGDRKDIAPTVLENFMDLDQIYPPLNGRPLTRRYLWSYGTNYSGEYKIFDAVIGGEGGS